MNVGYYKVWRKATEGKLWNAKPYNQWHAFEYLIARAAWRNHDVWYQAVAIQLKRGQLATTERQLAKDWGWGRTKVRSFLKSLENSAMIQTEVKPRHSVITITNYETYQGDGENPNQSQATDRTGTEPEPNRSRATREEVKKNKQEVNKNAAPTPPPLTAASAPQNGQQTNGPTADDDPPVPDLAVEHYNAGRLREALNVCCDAGCYYHARRLAMKLGDLKEVDRLSRLIEERMATRDPAGPIEEAAANEGRMG